MGKTKCQVLSRGASSGLFELETDSATALGGWTIDDIALTGHRSEASCGCRDVPPVAVGDALRVARSGQDAVLSWTGSTSTSTLFRAYRRVSLRRFPPTGSMALAADSIGARTWTEPDGATTNPLVYFEVKAINACGSEE